MSGDPTQIINFRISIYKKLPSNPVYIFFQISKQFYFKSWHLFILTVFLEIHLAPFRYIQFWYKITIAVEHWVAETLMRINESNAVEAISTL